LQATNELDVMKKWILLTELYLQNKYFKP
jgi:hypothetical protein